jgi:DNA-binding IclR family transcriptional regulator
MNSSLISSTLPVFEVLHLIANSNEPLSTADLSRSMNLPTSTVHRFLGTLEQAGYISRYLGSARFIPGNMPQHLCRAMFNRFPLSRIAPPFLQQLASLTRMTVTLMVRIGWFGLRIEILGDANPVGTIAGGQTLAPLHVPMEGRAILAFLSESEIEGYQRYFRKHGGDIAGPKARFWSELERHVKRGFVLSEPIGMEKDRAALALPVLDQGSQPIAAIGIVGPAVDANLNDATDLVQSWIKVVDALEAALAADPGGTLGPFVHLDPDAILPRLSQS